jgi:glycosyltransferase involved in cell wall biosynthesis
MNRKILLISYVFPPYPGIGGRRWAKFAKYLAASGFDVHVITAKNPFAEQSTWVSDTVHPSIHLHPLPAKYPAILQTQPSTVLQKLRYRIWESAFRFFSKGSVFERSLFWKKQLHREAGELIRIHKIKNVIVTAPPFHLLHHAVELKKDHPGIRVIADFRDPWTDNASFMEFSTMPQDRLAFERQLEMEVLEKADIVLTVAGHMSEKLAAKLKNNQGKITTLINGYDPDEIEAHPVNAASVDRGQMRFVYAGSLYPNLEYVFVPFADFLVKLREANPVLYRKLSFRFFGSAAVEMQNIIKERKLGDIVRFNGWISRQAIGEEMEKADACMLFFAEAHSFSMNTKLFEYLAHRKPVILFSGPGETPDFIRHNRLGFVVGPEGLESSLRKIIDQHFSDRLAINNEFDLRPFSIPALTQQLIGLLDKS